MAAAAAAISHPLLFFPSSILKPKRQISSNSCKSHPSISSPLKLVAPHLPTTANSSRPCPLCPASLCSTRWKLSAIQGTLFLLDTSLLEENTQEIVSATDGDAGGSSYSIVAALIFVAFIGLSVLTIGVIYIAVTDFLQRRERDKFEKELTAKEKSRKGKIRTRARGGPRGFGQKIEVEDEPDEV